MSLIIFLVCVLIVIALLVYAVDLIPNLTPPFDNLIKLLIIIGGVLVIIERTGVL